jgi:hypothetical protein
MNAMMYRETALMTLAALLLTATLASAGQAPAPLPSPAPTYDQLVSVGYELAQAGQGAEAYVAAVEALKVDPKRFEAYALASLVLYQRDDHDRAAEFVRKAMQRAPAARMPKLRELAASIDAERGVDAPAVAASAPEVPEARPPQATSRGSLAGTVWSGIFKDFNRKNELVSTAPLSLSFAANGQGEAIYFDGKKKLRWEQVGRNVIVKIDGPRGYNPELRGQVTGGKLGGVWSDPFYGGNSRWEVDREE